VFGKVEEYVEHALHRLPIYSGRLFGNYHPVANLCLHGKSAPSFLLLRQGENLEQCHVNAVSQHDDVSLARFSDASGSESSKPNTCSLSMHDCYQHDLYNGSIKGIQEESSSSESP